MTELKCIIMGAAGRDFHDFLTFFEAHPEFRLCAFTAHQIPFIEERKFPASLAGPRYRDDIPIYPEARLPELIDRFGVDFVFLSYSDLAHEEVMHKASLVQACGASFGILGPRHTQIRSTKPVLSVTAVRTGAGKSPLSQAITEHLFQRGLRVGVIRHPMPYGDLQKQAVQRFATPEDFDRHACTVEEREEYQPYVERGLVIYAGVDYRAILRQAEEESDVILWDGGNNDLPFLQSSLRIVVADALRPGHELSYYPGEANFRSADVIVVNKVGQARRDDVERILAHAREVSSTAEVIEADLEIRVDRPELVRGRRVLVVEDGPTLTHGGMSSGAGMIAAREHGAAEVVDPRPHAVGTIAEAYAKFPQLTKVLPALGYSDRQRAELATSIRATRAEVVVDASPAGLGRILDLDLPVARVSYAFAQRTGAPLMERIDRWVTEA